MERRALLYGSGVAFTTALAGCLGGDDGTDDEAGADNGTDDDGGTGDDTGTDDGDGEDSIGDVPGVDETDLDLDGYEISIQQVEHNGRVLEIEVVTTKDDPDFDRLRDQLETLGDKLAAAIHDPYEFERETDTVTLVVFDEDGTEVLVFGVDVQWAVALVRDEIDVEELLEHGEVTKH